MKNDRPEPLQNLVKSRLRRGEIVTTMAVRLVRSVEIARIAKTAGFDSIYVDLEHSPMDFDAAGQICLMALETGITPLVRLPTNRAEYIARAFDGGAMGVIAPNVQSAAEARAIVQAAKYPPLGKRGLASGSSLLGFRTYPAGEAMTIINAATMVVVQIESALAVEQVDEIMAVEGIDLAFVGTSDLCAELGIPGQFDHPLVHSAYERTIAACLRHSKHAGIGGLPSRPELMKQYVDMGARYISTGTDLGFLLGAAEQRNREARNLLTFRSSS